MYIWKRKDRRWAMYLWMYVCVCVGMCMFDVRTNLYDCAVQKENRDALPTHPALRLYCKYHT